MKYTPYAFTLVELIVVMTIVTILSTLAFVSYQSHSIDARDGNRVADMGNLDKALEVAFTRSGVVPQPYQSVDITATWTTILSQWYLWTGALLEIWMHIGGRDPKDQSYYSYVTDTRSTVYQLLWFLEQDNSLSSTHLLPQTYASLAERFPITAGDGLWVLLDYQSKQPIQASGSWVDIALTTQSYLLYLGNNPDDIISWTGAVLFPRIYEENPFLFPISYQ